MKFLINLKHCELKVKTTEKLKIKFTRKNHSDFWTIVTALTDVLGYIYMSFACKILTFFWNILYAIGNIRVKIMKEHKQMLQI